jgi:hypothetical protein
MTQLTIEQRIDQAEAAHREGRIIQNAWRQNESSHGRELVCALAAFGPDINSSADCPADLMPAWLAELIPTLDDGIAADDVPWFMGELLIRARQWQSFDAAAWERVRTGFLIRTIQIAVDEAANAQPAEPPAYWQQVLDAIKKVREALSGNGDLAAADAAAYAAARAAYAAADAAADAAAYAAARAARAAAYAAARAARAAADAAAYAAARAARAAMRRIAEALFSIIDAESAA